MVIVGWAKGKKMPRLIDADNLLEQIQWLEADAPVFHDVWEEICSQPTVDAEPVVRCKDCKHWHESVCFKGEQGQTLGQCDCTMSMRDTDFFCKAGEKERR